MVVLLDLDDKNSLGPHIDPTSTRAFPTPVRKVTKASTSVTSGQRPNANINGFSAALGCYPIVSQLTQSLDRNTLHALSRTCKQFRQILLHYRDSLVQQTLRCDFDGASPRELSNDVQAIPNGLLPRSNNGHAIFSGKIGPCARDMVGDCRRCGVTICRNCAQKPPSPVKLPHRHRRLCTTCLAAPLPTLLLHDSLPRDPCTCDSAVYLCTHCGSGLSQDDTTYRRIWHWRTHYSTYLGGLGTGVGEGNEGVKCARKEQCLGAQIVDVEGECPAAGESPPRRSATPSSSSSSPDGELLGEEVEAGYLRQEIEGIGGVVKKKYKRRVRVGAPVREWEDEREGGELLGREISREARSWCGWCKRVVPGKADMRGISEKH